MQAAVVSSIAPSRLLARARVASIDVVRGMVIVLMVLDHVRDYFGDTSFDATDLTRTTPALFFTRWITHLCAPTFIFLAGVSASLNRLEPTALRAFLLKRGLWLVLLEFTLVRFVWLFNVDYSSGLIFQVIWAIGASMIALAAMSALPKPWLAAIALLMIAGHNAFDDVKPTQLGAWAPLWILLHVQARTWFGMVVYPLIPWVGVMALGFVAGDLWSRPNRKTWLYALAASSLLAFAVLRALNRYGDPRPWTAQTRFPALSFVNVSKYPPSLLYVLLTLGIAFFALAALDGRRGRALSIFELFGRVPLFAYVVHIALAHALAGLLALALGFGDGVLFHAFFEFPPGWGLPLPGVYVAWLVVLSLLYPLCRWFAAVKRRRSDWWLAYL